MKKCNSFPSGDANSIEPKCQIQLKLKCFSHNIFKNYAKYYLGKEIGFPDGSSLLLKYYALWHFFISFDHRYWQLYTLTHTQNPVHNKIPFEFQFVSLRAHNWQKLKVGFKKSKKVPATKSITQKSLGYLFPNIDKNFEFYGYVKFKAVL